MKLSDKISGAIERMSPKKLLALCGLAAILVFLIIYFILSAAFSDKKESKPAAAAMVPVIEASRDIEPQTVITEDMVKAVEVSSNMVPSGALTDKNAVVGKKAGTTIFSGDMITARKLSQKAGGFVGLIPDGMRAVSFSVNDVTGVSGFAKPGDKVDILLVTSREGMNRITSKILLKDVLILAVNKSSGTPQPQSQNTDKDGKGMPSGSAPRTNTSSASMGTPSVVTVALTPYDAAKLIASTQIGQLQMLLRPSNDEGDHYVGYYVIPLPKAEQPQPAPQVAPQPVYAAPQPSQSASAPAVSISSGGPSGGLSGIEVIRGTNVSRGQ